MTLTDRIERTMVLPAQRQRVWEAVTKPEQLARWFGVVQRFAFRWPSYAISHPEITFATAPSTLVDITLEEHAEGTLLTLVESGFASQPQSVPAEELYRGNQDGWQECLNGLHAYLQSQEVV